MGRGPGSARFHLISKSLSFLSPQTGGALGWDCLPDQVEAAAQAPSSVPDTG